MPNPSIKDEEQYEALRRDGASKEKAARIANASAATSREDTARRGGAAAPYEEWTRDELYERAKDLDVQGRSSMDKGELIRSLRER